MNDLSQLGLADMLHGYGESRDQLIWGQIQRPTLSADADMFVVSLPPELEAYARRDPERMGAPSPETRKQHRPFHHEPLLPTFFNSARVV